MWIWDSSLSWVLPDGRDVGSLEAGGLEVLLQGEETGEGVWTAVKPIDGCFVVNIGDLYEVWTNGRWVRK